MTLVGMKLPDGSKHCLCVFKQLSSQSLAKEKEKSKDGLLLISRGEGPAKGYLSINMSLIPKEVIGFVPTTYLG
jgi:hypothetical protein